MKLEFDNSSFLILLVKVFLKCLDHFLSIFKKIIYIDIINLESLLKE